jgi:PAS domain S-box-containing protein
VSGKFNPSPEQVRAHLSAIVELSDDAIVTKDLSGIVQSWNPAAQRIFGYRADEVIGKPITLLVPAERLNEEDEILERIRRGERVDQITELGRKDGQRITVSVTVVPVRNAAGEIIGAARLIRDMTLRARLEGMFTNIVSSSDDAIISKDTNGIVQSWNAGAERVFGYTAADMIGQSITKIIPADRQDEEPRILAKIRKGERVDHFETVRQRKDGELIDVSVTISPIKDPAGRIVGVSKIARDITALKRAEREKGELLRREQAARQEAERVSRIKDEFLATLSHELRTPLNAILGWSQLLRESGMDSQDFQQGLDTIARNAKVQAQLIEDLLDMSRIISGKLRLNVQKLNLCHVVESALAAVKPAADAKEIVVQQVLDATAGAVYGDPNRLQQVVWNLLSNAIKFTPRGGKVQVMLARASSHVEITVSDNGQGIKADFLPHIFHRFTQADASTTRRHGGLGIGLAIVRHLVELHGGAVKARSAGEGQGATFTVALPIMAVEQSREDESGGEPKDRAALPAMMALSNLKVLVVDDDPDARELIGRVLESCDASVRTARSAAEGLDLLKEYRPDILLADIGMPEEDGYAFIQKVRQLPASMGGQTPAVALTAFARSEDRRRALLSGFQMHLAKPVEPAELIAVVASLTSRRIDSI